MKKEIIKFVALLLVAMGAGPAGAAFWQWSQTASNNATADPTINWAEGQPPSSVNDSARAMMARLAEQGADTSGQLIATGGPVAYTVTSNQGFPNPPQNGQVIGLTVAVANGANPTLSVDGATAAPMLSQTGSAVPAGTLLPGTAYTLRYVTATSSWMLRNYFGGEPDSVPIGGMVAYTGTVVPNANWIFAAGQCISTTTYATYWALMGSPAPGSCTAGNFAVVDMRGRVAAGLDNMAGTAANRLTSAGCGATATAVGVVCASGLETHTMSVAEMALHNHTINISDPGHYHTITWTDPGHYHPVALIDPGHSHNAPIYDPTHYHQQATNTMVAGGGGNLYGAGGGAFSFTASNTQPASTGVRVNGAALDYTAVAGAGEYPSSPNGNNTTYSQPTGITFTGGGGANTTVAKVSGITASSTNNGSSSPFTNVQPTLVVNYIIRVQ